MTHPSTGGATDAVRHCPVPMIPLRLNLNSQFYSPYPLYVVGLQAASMVKCPGVAFDPVEIFDAVRHAPRSVHRIARARAS